MESFNFKDLHIRSEVRLQFSEKGNLEPPKDMSSEDLAIWRDEARKIQQRECGK